MSRQYLSRRRSADGIDYRDLNGNGVMDAFEDPRLPVEERVADLLPRLSLAEKVGLMFHPIIAADPDAALVTDRFLNHFNVHDLPEPRLAAQWTNRLQKLAEQTPHGIPVTISTDPRHSFAVNAGASFRTEHFSTWPEPLGLGAIGDEATVRRFADIARQEYTAVGIRSALHPTIDLATEPRWARQYSTFGDDADLAGRLAVAYLDGFEGPALGADSVACIAKHFPGGGPQRDGEDPHFPYGREQVYPGDMFEYHLEPFRRVIERGVSAIMPYYGMPVGLVIDGEPIEEVGFGFNRQIITGLLREKLGFDGVICTDWGLVTASERGGRPLPARAWGVEHLDAPNRVRRIVEAGCDQLGGEDDTALLIGLVEAGIVEEARIDESAARLLRVKFELGLFDDPYVDEDAAEGRVATPEFVAAGFEAQARAAVVLTGHSLLPLSPGTRVYSPEFAREALESRGLAAATAPEDADVAVVRLDAPFDPRDRYMLEASFRAGGLEFATETVEAVRALAEQMPVVVVIHLDRPAVLTPLVDTADAVVAVFGASDSAVADVLTGRVRAEGKLPFQLPRDGASVERSRPDVAADLEDPLFDRGYAGV
jgi:beta-glucosidase